MTNTTSVILVSVGLAVVSSSGSSKVCESYAAVFWGCQIFVLTAVFPIAEHKRAAVSDAGQSPLQQENSPALAHSSRGKFLADSHFPWSSTPMKRLPPSEFMNAATVLATTCSSFLFTSPVRMSYRRVDLNSTSWPSPSRIISWMGSI